MHVRMYSMWVLSVRVFKCVYVSVLLSLFQSINQLTNSSKSSSINVCACLCVSVCMHLHSHTMHYQAALPLHGGAPCGIVHIRLQSRRHPEHLGTV